MGNNTDNGRVLASSQILYGQYHIWDIYVLGLTTKVFGRKNNQIHFPTDKVLKVPK